MDLSQSAEDNIPVTTSTGGDRSSEEASAVAQLLEMAQSYQVEHPNPNKDDEEANDEDADDTDAPAAEEADDNDEAPEKDPYEMSGKEAEFKCHCKYNKGKPCFSRYEKQELMAFRGQYKALNKKELDIAILSKIQTGMHLSPLTCQKKKAHTERKKVRSDHYFHGDKICRDTFCFIHRISHNKLSVLMAHYRGSGICVRVMKRQAAKEKAEALAKQTNKAKRGKAKGKAGTGKPPRKRKPKTGAAKQVNNNKRQRQSGAVVGVSSVGSNSSVGGAVADNIPIPLTIHQNDTDAASAMARHIEAMHQYVDIPIGQMQRRAADKRYMDVSRLPAEASTTQTTSHQHPHHHHVASSASVMSAGGGRPESVQQTQAQHHHGVWHLPRRPDMQHEGPYLLPL